MDSVVGAFSSFIDFIPALLGAVVVLVVGWLLARGVGRLVRRGLRALGFDRAIGATGLATYLQRFGSGWTGSSVCGVMTMWFLRLVTIQAAASVLALPELSRVINGFILLVPNLFVAFLVLVAGAIAAQFAGKTARASTVTLGRASPERIERIVTAVVFVVAVFAACNQLGVAPVIINTLFIGFVAALALALGLAFGLGGRAVAGDLTQSWLEQGHRIVTSETAPEATATRGESRSHH
jgi:hypothetical protein